MEGKKYEGIFSKLFAILLVAVLAFAILYLPPLLRREKTVVEQSRTVAALSVEQMALESDLVARGTAVEGSSPFLVQPQDGRDPSVFVDYTFAVKQVYRCGQEKEPQELTIRVEGGTYQDITVNTSGSPSFEIGKEYIVFLYRAPKNGGYETEGEYYYVTGFEHGVFQETPEEKTDLSAVKAQKTDKASRFSALETAEAYFVSEKALQREENGKIKVEAAEEILSEQAFSKEIAAFNQEYPEEIDYYKKRQEEAYRSNLETGMITEEEYEQWAAELEQEDGPYAEIRR